MADSQEELNFIVRMIFPDAKVPPLDTREAEAAVAKLKGIVKQAQSEVAAGVNSMVGSVGAAASSASPVPAPIPGYPAPSAGYGFAAGQTAPFTMGWDAKAKQAVFNYAQGSPYGPSAPPALYSSPAFPGGRDANNPFGARGQYGYAAGPGFASGGSGVRWANNAPGPGNWSMGSGNWSQGPVSDPGTAMRSSSLSTARGYDQAMLRESLNGLDFNAADGGLTKITRGLTQAREASVGLAASLVLLNKSMEKGSGWDNWYTQGTAAIGIGSYGLRLGQSAVNLTQGAAGIGQGVLAGAAAGAGGRSVLARGLAAGSRALGSLAGAGGARALGLVGGPAVATIAAMKGIEGYYNYQSETALDNIADLDNSLQSRNEYNRQLGMMGRSNDAAFYSQQLGVGATVDFRRAMSGELSSFSLESQNRRRFDAMGMNANVARGDFSSFSGPGDEGARVNAGEQLVNILRQQQQILSQNVQKRQQELQIQTQQARVAQQEVDAARQLAGRAGRVSNADWRRGAAALRRAQGSGLTERDAEALDELPGFGGALEKFFQNRGQQRIDAIPKEFRDEDAKGKSEIAALEAKIKQFETTQGSAVKALQDYVRLNAGAWETIEQEINVVKKEVSDIIARNPKSFKGR